MNAEVHMQSVTTYFLGVIRKLFVKEKEKNGNIKKRA